MKELSCKHNAGWWAQEIILVWRDGKLIVGNHRTDAAIFKVKVECNAGCGATRNAYISGARVKLGKVKVK